MVSAILEQAMNQTPELVDDLVCEGAGDAPLALVLVVGCQAYRTGDQMICWHGL